MMIMSTPSVDKLHIPPLASLQGEIILPGSKSLTNRMLLLSALSEGSTVVENVLDSDDTQVMLQALEKLNVKFHYDKDQRRAVIQGQGGPFYVNDPLELYLGENCST